MTVMLTLARCEAHHEPAKTYGKQYFTQIISHRRLRRDGGSALPEDATSVEIIDIHQHTHYSGRGDEELVAHQRTMGVTKTVLLPAGSKYGLEADAWGNDSVVALAKKHPGEFYFFANELPDIPETRAVIEKYLKLGANGIGEQKF